ncbi:coenzyme Q-binding protein COQ10-like protein, mitochondrial-like [Iris pallida]|uniref:Coenzyme Q-binding protein COQ10-like protein, mitochondrial-like n=1 Tax=Iris pallida TaxID=29817 RepID=A0AAX6DKH0_IRIPA|nr:coenzyme Q-binding protein COQ10-like protein, mitochondrial-like [Iris pallida]
MPPVVSLARALARLAPGRSRVLDTRLASSSSENLGKFDLFSQNRRFSSSNSVARIGNPCVDSSLSADREFGPSVRGPNCSTQTRRRFIGAGDGEEGDVLSKVYEERRIMGYSQEQLFAVVAAVDLYEDFVPWCQRSQILRKNRDGSFNAELQIGFKFLVESYVSHVEMKKPTYIKTTASESSLFDHLINIWEFNPGPVPGTCDIYFLVDFKFQSPLYRQVASLFFKEVVARLVGSFNDRCQRIYGPGVQVLENAYGHGR